MEGRGGGQTAWPCCCGRRICGRTAVAAAGNHPVAQIVLGDAAAAVAELAALFLENFPGVALGRLRNGCFIRHGAHLVRFLANGKEDLLTGAFSFFLKRQFLSELERKRFFQALAPVALGAPRRTGNA